MTSAADSPKSQSAQFSFGLQSFGVRFRVTTDATEVLERIPSLLPPDARSCSKAGDEFAVLSGEDGLYRFTWPDCLEPAMLDLESILSALETQLQVYVGLRAPGQIFVHAGVVAHEGKAIVIPGVSFSGKSTLVLALLHAGAAYYSDEFAVIDERGLVHPYAAPLWLRDPPPARYHDVAGFEGGQGSEPLPIGAVLVTRYRAGTEWNPARLSPAQGALALLANTLSALARPAESLRLITRAVDGAVVLEGDRGEAADVAQGLLERASPPQRATSWSPSSAVRSSVSKPSSSR